MAFYASNARIVDEFHGRTYSNEMLEDFVNLPKILILFHCTSKQSLGANWLRGMAALNHF